MTRFAYFCGHEQWHPEQLVRHAQLAENAGFDPGPIDGAFGRLTEQAVVALQRANGLELNGRVSQTEWDLLLGGLLMQSGQRGDDVRTFHTLSFTLDVEKCYPLTREADAQ